MMSFVVMVHLEFLPSTTHSTLSRSAAKRTPRYSLSRANFEHRTPNQEYRMVREPSLFVVWWWCPSWPGTSWILLALHHSTLSRPVAKRTPRYSLSRANFEQRTPNQEYRMVREPSLFVVWWWCPLWPGTSWILLALHTHHWADPRRSGLLDIRHSLFDIQEWFCFNFSLSLLLDLP